LAGRPDVVAPGDVRGREPCDRARRGLEAPQVVAVLRHERVQQLDRHVAFELQLAGAPDDAHPAFTDLLEQLVATGQDRHRPPPTPPQLSTRSGTPPSLSVAVTLLLCRSG